MNSLTSLNRKFLKCFDLFGLLEWKTLNRFMTGISSNCDIIIGFGFCVLYFLSLSLYLSISSLPDFEVLLKVWQGGCLPLWFHPEQLSQRFNEELNWRFSFLASRRLLLKIIRGLSSHYFYINTTWGNPISKCNQRTVNKMFPVCHFVLVKFGK